LPLNMPVNPPNRENDVDLFLVIVSRRSNPPTLGESGGELYFCLGPRSEACFDLFGDEPDPMLGNTIRGGGCTFASAGAGLRSVRGECSFVSLVDFMVPELLVIVSLPKGLFSWISSCILGTLSLLLSPVLSAFITGLSTTRLEGTES
jgi:hypothetical protein